MAFRQAARPKYFSVEPGRRKGRAFPHTRRQSRDFFTPSGTVGYAAERDRSFGAEFLNELVTQGASGYKLLRVVRPTRAPPFCRASGANPARAALLSHRLSDNPYIPLGIAFKRGA